MTELKGLYAIYDKLGDEITSKIVGKLEIDV